MQLIVFDHRIRQQVTTKTVQPLFQACVRAININFHELADSDAAHLRHPQMSHRIANGVALRIQHSFLRFDDYIYLHPNTLTRNFSATSGSQGASDAALRRPYIKGTFCAN